MSEPAYLDADWQAFSGRQIFLADIRTDASIITAKFDTQIEFHDPGDVSSQVFLSPAAYPGAATQVQVLFPATNGSLAMLSVANAWTASQGFYAGASFILDPSNILDFVGDYSGDPVIATLSDNFMSEVITLKGPGVNIDASTTQRFQNGSGFLALAPIAGGTPVVGNSTDPPASGAIGKVNRTAQAAAIAATKLTDATAAGYYVVHYTLEDTTAGLGAGTIQFQINYTDDVGATTQQGATLALNATGRDRGSFEVYLASGDISYQTNVVGIFSTAQYALRVRCIYLG